MKTGNTFSAATVAVVLLLATVAHAGDLFEEAGVVRPLTSIEAPAFGPAPLPSVDGPGAAVADYRGRVVLVNFWATWCAPCRDEMPSMERLYREFEGRGLVVVAVSLDRGRAAERVRRFAAKLGVTFPVLIDQGGHAADTYEVAALPTSYIIGRDGFIIGRAIGSRDWDSPETRRLFESLLEE